MPDTHTVVTSRSWGSRLKGSFKGIFVGFLLVGIAFVLLFWNEGRAVKRHKTLEEGAGAVVSVGADRVDPANEGKLVHVTGMTASGEILTDPQFGVTASALHLERRVEMYQWKEETTSETRKKVGGGTETTTTYSYVQDWSERPIDSRTFDRPEGHRNPETMPYTSRTVSASDVGLGAFQLSPALIGRIDAWEPLPLRTTALLPAALQARARLHEGGLYLGADPAAPQIGDLRIRFRQVSPTAVSLVARQVGPSFAPYQTRAGGSIEMLRTGIATADEMIQTAQESNRLMTWILRGLGFVLMMVGIRTILRPLSVLADVLPALGNLAEKGTGAFAFFMALLLALPTIAIAWLFYRPLLGLTVLALAVGAAVLVWRMVKKARAGGAAPSAAPPPPPPPPAPQSAG